jgi:hypothetical protein
MKKIPMLPKYHSDMLETPAMRDFKAYQLSNEENWRTFWLLLASGAMLFAALFILCMRLAHLLAACRTGH